MARKALFVTGALLALTTISLHATEAVVETIRAHYSLKYLNLTVGEIVTFADVRASDYRALLDAHVAGLAAMASSFKTKMASNGVMRKGSVLPNAFTATEASGSSGDHKVQMLLDAGNVRTVDIDPPFADVPGMVPITE
jgi:Protein of unknown function (DUF3108)